MGRILVISDCHLGRDPELDRRIENDLEDLLESFHADLDQVLLLGDIFDAFIEYPNRDIEVGRMFFRQLRDLDAVDVHYAVGNHDPWHRSLLGQLYGINTILEQSVVEQYGRRILFSHGDLLLSSPRRRRIKTFLRHRTCLRLYTALIPYRFGTRLASWVSRRYSDHGIDDHTPDAMKVLAGELIRSKQLSAVLLGHTHQATIDKLGAGLYGNPGSWFMDRTFLILDDLGISLLAWRDGEAVLLDAHAYETVTQQFSLV